MPKEVLLSRGENVVVLTLNRPPSNLVNRALLVALGKAVDKVVEDVTIRAVVVAGGERDFSEGLDVEAFRKLSEEEKAALARLGQDVLWRLEHAPMPTIAAMAGKVIGAGLEIALACDMRVASEDAQFSHPEISQGLVPLFGNTFRLERLIGRSRSRSLLFFGDPIPSWEALEIGLVGRVAPPGSSLEEARIAAGRIAAQPAGSVRAAKRAMLEAEEKGCKESLDKVAEQIARLGLNRD